MVFLLFTNKLPQILFHGHPVDFDQLSGNKSPEMILRADEIHGIHHFGS